MATYEESKTYVTPPFKVAYVHLHKPKAMKGYTKEYYSIAALVPKAKLDLYRELFKQMGGEFTRIEEKLGIKDPKGLKGQFSEFKHEDFEDTQMINFKSHAFKKDGTPLAAPECYVMQNDDLKKIGGDKIVSGDYCAIGFSVLGQDINNRITLKLKAVRLVQKGDPISYDDTASEMSEAAKAKDDADLSAFLGDDASDVNMDTVLANSAMPAEQEAPDAEVKPDPEPTAAAATEEAKPADKEAHQSEAIEPEGDVDTSFDPDSLFFEEE